MELGIVYAVLALTVFAPADREDGHQQSCWDRHWKQYLRFYVD